MSAVGKVHLKHNQCIRVFSQFVLAPKFTNSYFRAALPIGSVSLARLELQVDRHVYHLHGHVGVVEGGVQEDRDGHRQEDGDGGGRQRGHHGAGGQKSRHPRFQKGREEKRK